MDFMFSWQSKGSHGFILVFMKHPFLKRNKNKLKLWKRTFLWNLLFIKKTSYLKQDSLDGDTRTNACNNSHIHEMTSTFPKEIISSCGPSYG